MWLVKNIFVGLSFWCGLVVAALAIAYTLGNPFDLYASQRTEKLVILDQLGARACSAAFGSSHIHNGFDPRTFDSALADGQLPTQSINMAISGGSQGEQYVMAKHFLASKASPPSPACHPMILLEINAGANFQSAHLTHPRAINIYDHALVSLLGDFVSSDLPFYRYVGRAAFAYMEEAMHYLNVGMLASRWLPHRYDLETIALQTAEDRRGLLTEPPAPSDVVAVAQAFRDKPEQAGAQPAQVMRGAASMVAALRQQAGGSAFDYVYIVAPKLTDLVAYETYPACINVGDTKVRVINVAQPPLYPELYKPDVWRDPGHLNGRGAVEYTRLLAKEIAATAPVGVSASTHCVSL